MNANIDEINRNGIKVNKKARNMYIKKINRSTGFDNILHSFGRVLKQH